MIQSGHSQQDWILAIDDEAAILDIVKTALEPEGYTVHIASTPTEGIEFYEQNWRSIKLVLLDFMMPEMTGDIVVEHLQRINPDIRVLLLSGSYVMQGNNEFEGRLHGYIRKPFSLDALTLRVKDAINSN
jgi:two-component system, cell cycle sensor histidine kinase and response regulator CckA